MSTTATYNFNDPSSAYLLVTFATYPQAFGSLQLDSLMSDPSRLCSGYTVSPPCKSVLSRLASVTLHGQLPHQQPAPAMWSWIGCYCGTLPDMPAVVQITNNTVSNNRGRGEHLALRM